MCGTTCHKWHEWHSKPQVAKIEFLGIIIPMKAGVDIGFGWTKVYVDGKAFRFPTWIGVWGGYAISDVEPISFEGRDYVVGYPARFSRQRIEVSSYEELLRFMPLIAMAVKREIGDIPLVGGLSPKHYAMYRKDSKAQKRLGEYFEKVLPQGFGVLVDVHPELSLSEGEQVVVVDIGFNTVDFAVVIWEGESYRRIALDSIEGLGVLQAVEVFRKHLPAEKVGFVKDWSVQRLLKVFEEGKLKIEGEELDLSQWREKAIEVYRDSLLSRLRGELGEGLSSSEHFVQAGGGAYLIGKLRADAIVPQEPEFSNARGFAKS